MVIALHVKHLALVMDLNFLMYVYILDVSGINTSWCTFYVVVYSQSFILLM